MLSKDTDFESLRIQIVNHKFAKRLGLDLQIK